MMIKPQLKNSGTYGCIYYPEYPCPTGEKQDMKFATKIHSNHESETVENEIAISDKIREQVADYELYFSPVVKRCKLHLAKVEGDKCKIFKDKKPAAFVATKMKYIRGDTLFTYVHKLGKKIKSHEKLYEEVVALYRKICTCVDKLKEINIVHFDLKDNNFIVKETGTPICIDFGISIDMDKLFSEIYSSGHKDEDVEFNKALKRTFYAFTTEYYPWCIDIVLISFIVEEKKRNDKVKTEEIIDIFDKVAKYNRFDSIPYLKDAFVTYRQKFKQNIDDKFRDKNCSTLVDNLLKNYTKWDQYSAGILFVNMLGEIKQSPNSKHIDEIKKRLGFME